MNCKSCHRNVPEKIILQISLKHCITPQSTLQQKIIFFEEIVHDILMLI